MSRTYRKASRDTHDRKSCPQCRANLFERQLPLPFDDAEPEEFPLSLHCECMVEDDDGR